MKTLSLFVIFSLFLILSLQAKADDPVIYLRFSDSTSLDPGQAINQYNGEVVSNIFEGLVQYRKGSNEIFPCLAEKWELSGDGKHWRFFLRNNVYFHDGRPFNADDVIYSFKIRMEQGIKKYQKWKLFFPDIKDVRKKDALTVDIILEKPSAPFLTLLTDPVAYIVKEGSCDSPVFHPIGTGAFVFSIWKRGKHIILNRNDKYWGNRIRFKKVIFKIIPNLTSRINLVKTGQAHILELRSGREFLHFLGNRDISIISNSLGGTFFLAFNTLRPPFDKVEVRRAFAHLINKEVLIRQIYGNFAIPATTPLPPLIKGFNPGIKNFPFDLNKAKKLLKRAGLASGFSCNVTFLESEPGEQRIIDTFARSGRKIGIRINRNPLPFNKIWEKIRKRDFDIVLRGWIAGPDPDIYLYSNFTMDEGNSNWAGYSDPELTALLLKGRETLEESKRILIYKRIQEIIYRDVPWIPLMHMKYLTIQHRSIKNVYINSNSFLIFKEAYREK